MNKKLAIICAAILCLALPAISRASDKDNDISRTQNATRVFQEIMNAPDSIPHDVLAKAHCVGIIPGDKKFAFIFGGNYGRGVAICRAGTVIGAPRFTWRLKAEAWATRSAARPPI